MTRLECEYCHELATHRVEAQWTIFDWDFIHACHEHARYAYRDLSRRTVDGVRPLEMHVTKWGE